MFVKDVIAESLSYVSVYLIFACLTFPSVLLSRLLISASNYHLFFHITFLPKTYALPLLSIFIFFMNVIFTRFHFILGKVT